MAYTPTGNPAGWDGSLRGRAHRRVIEEGWTVAAAAKELKEAGATAQVIANFKVNISSPTSIAKAERAARSRARKARKEAAAKAAAKKAPVAKKTAPKAVLDDIIGTPVKKAPAKKAAVKKAPAKKAAAKR